jgi:hypothetical protein
MQTKGRGKGGDREREGEERHAERKSDRYR